MTETTDTQFRGVLIYDGDCPFCSAAASALRQLDDVGAVEWDHDAAQQFLEAQFGDVPFALVFVDIAGERVWAGREAARELCERAGMPVLIQDVVGDNYEKLADAIRRVSGLEAEPDPYHGEYPLADGADDACERLAANARQTHLPGREGPTGTRRSSAAPPSDAHRESDSGRDGSPGRTDRTGDEEVGR